MPNAHQGWMAELRFELRYSEPWLLNPLLSAVFNIVFSGCPMTYFSFTKVTFMNIFEATFLFNAHKRTFWVKGHLKSFPGKHRKGCFCNNTSFGAKTR